MDLNPGNADYNTLLKEDMRKTEICAGKCPCDGIKYLGRD